MGVEEVLEAHKLTISISGMWPEECQRMPKYNTFKIWSILIMDVALCVFQTAGVMLFATSDTAPDYFMDLTGYITTTVRTIIVILNRDKILELLMDVKQYQRVLTHTDEERKILNFWDSCRRNIAKGISRSYWLCMVAYFVAVFFVSDKILPLKLIFKPNSLFTPWYEIIFVGEMIIFGLIICSISTCDIIYITLLCQICEELQLIKLLLKNSRRNDSNNLMSIIKRHSMILEYGGRACDVVSEAYFWQHFLISMILCASVFTCITTNNSGTMNKMIWVSVTCVSLIFIICFAGELVKFYSEEIADVLMESDLVSYDCRDKDELLNLHRIFFVLHRAQKPLKLSVGTFGLFNLQLFCKTMKNISSCMMVLRNFYV